MTKNYPVSIIFAAVLLACAAPAFAADTPAQLAQIFKNVPKLNPKMALATTRVHYIPIPFVPISSGQMPNPQGPAPAYGIAATVAMQNTPTTKVQTNTGLPAGGGVGAPTATPTCTGSTPAPYYGLTNGACVEQTYVCSTSGQWTFGPQVPAASSYCGGTTPTTTTPTTTTNTTPTATPTAAVCSATTAAPSCPSGDVETSAPSWNTSSCQWVTACAVPTFANTASASAGTATSCNAGYTLTNGYCVASNAYVANGYGDLGLGYTTLNLYNAVYSPNANGQYVWSGNIGIQIGGGTALQYGSLNAAFLNTSASSGTVTISNSETAVGPLGLSMLSGSGGGTFNNAYETPAQIAASGYGEVLSVIMGGGPSAFSGAAPGTNVTLTGTNANGTTYTRELYNGPTAGPTTAALYFNNSGFYLLEQNPGACGSINGGGGNLFVSGSPTTGATILGGQGCNAVVGGGCIPGPNGQCTNSYNAVVAQLTSDICTGTNTTTHPAAGTSACTTIVDAKAGPESNYTTPTQNGGGGAP